MPLYDFLCRSCGETFEAHTPVDQLPPCPVCGAAETERKLSGFAGPFNVGLRGLAARRSNAQRQAREEQRRERREARKQSSGES